MSDLTLKNLIITEGQEVLSEVFDPQPPQQTRVSPCINTLYVIT